MCSDVGVAVTVAVALVMLAWHGRRRASRALALPVTVYGVWFAVAGRTGLTTTGDTINASVLSKFPTFVATNLEVDLSHTPVGCRGARYELFAVVLAWLV